MNLDTEDFSTIIAVLETHATLQDHSALKTMELIGQQKANIPGSPLIPELMQTMTRLEDDASNLRRIAAAFEVGLKEDGVLVG
jgi:hypothetical protein